MPFFVNIEPILIQAVFDFFWIVSIHISYLATDLSKGNQHLDVLANYSEIKKALYLDQGAPYNLLWGKLRRDLHDSFRKHEQHLYAKDNNRKLCL